MRGFIVGVVTTIFVATLVAVVVGMTGRVSMRADILPSTIEKRFAMRMMDANVERNAPKVANPLASTDENLSAGASLYLQHCALCHGDPAHPQSALAKTLYPPPPQFLTDPPDMKENENYYIIVHGVRWTGMPGWKNVLNDHQIWEVVQFLAHMDNLPPAAKSVFGATPGNAAPPMSKMPMR